MVQSQHSTADFAANFYDQFMIWKKESNTIISLSIKTEESLIKLYERLSKIGYVVLFREPDIDDQATSLCILGTPEILKRLSYLPLSLKKREDPLSREVLTKNERIYKRKL